MTYDQGDEHDAGADGAAEAQKDPAAGGPAEAEPGGAGRSWAFRAWTRWRARRRPRDRFGVGRASGTYIASARRHALLVVALGLFAAQLARDEVGRRRAADLYGYVEKVLAVGEALGTASAWTRGEPWPHESASRWLGDETEARARMAAMVGPERVLVPVTFAREEVLFATTTDPANACKPVVFAVVGGDPAEGLALEVRYAAVWGQRARWKAVFGNVFLVRLQGRCEMARGTWRPFVVAAYGPGVARRAAVLDDGPAARLGVPPAAPARRTPDSAVLSAFLSAAQIGRLERFPDPFVDALDEAYLKNAAARAARGAANRSFGLEDWREAVAAVVDDALDPMDFWGFRFERGVGARAAPFALLALCVSFLYRVRRIDPCDLHAEPWMVLGARGAVEKAGSLAWMATTFLAVLGVAAATLVYECGGPWTPGQDAGGDAAWAAAGRVAGRMACPWSVCGVLLEAASAVALACAWRHAHRLAACSPSARCG